MPGTTFLILQSPTGYAVGHIPRSWTTRIDHLQGGVTGLSVNAAGTPATGTLVFRVVFRAFANDNKNVDELSTCGSIVIDGYKSAVAKFDRPLSSQLGDRFDNVKYWLEMEFVWRSDCSKVIELIDPPAPIFAEVVQA